jgi:hypothetical protein
MSGPRVCAEVFRRCGPPRRLGKKAWKVVALAVKSDYTLVTRKAACCRTLRSRSSCTAFPCWKDTNSNAPAGQPPDALPHGARCPVNRQRPQARRFDFAALAFWASFTASAHRPGARRPQAARQTG